MKFINFIPEISGKKLQNEFSELHELHKLEKYPLTSWTSEPQNGIHEKKKFMNEVHKVHEIHENFSWTL